jgi:O-antigen/teichoic acid export membrane protein
MDHETTATVAAQGGAVDRLGAGPTVVDGDGPRGAVAVRRKRTAHLWRPIRLASGRLSWGVADQAVSSITNFAVSIFILRTLGAVEYGAFTLAYVTYSFALNASRGLATDPLLVRFSGTDVPTWRRAVASCTGTASVVGLVAGLLVLAAASLLDGATRMAMLALGLTLPGLLLQDSWRFAFFALGRGKHALLNDGIWAAVLIPALVLLRITSRHPNIFWMVFAWGAAATVAAAIGPLQARVIPRPLGLRTWLSQHRDLGLRYLAEGTVNSGAIQLRTYGVSFIVGLAAVGYIQAATTLMGPFMVIFFGMGLVALPEASRILRRSPRHLLHFCVLESGGLALLGLAWGAVLLVAMPRGLGAWLLGPSWKPTYPLILPLMIAVAGSCVCVGAGTGLHALGAARRSLRGMILGSTVYVVCGLIGAATGGAIGTMRGNVVSAWIAAVIFWWQFHKARQEYQAGDGPGSDPAEQAAAPMVPGSEAIPIEAVPVPAELNRRPGFRREVDAANELASGTRRVNSS